VKSGSIDAQLRREKKKCFHLRTNVQNRKEKEKVELVRTRLTNHRESKAYITYYGVAAKPITWVAQFFQPTEIDCHLILR
jgi:hypothetical protein